MISFVAGTRPELIKIKPLFRLLQREKVDVCLVFTGQHPDLSVEHLRDFGDYVDLGVKRSSSSGLLEFSHSVLERLGAYFKEEEPEAVVVQGDTVSAFVGAYAAYVAEIPVFHVEAGLRTHDPFDPFPEEFYRSAIDRVSTLLFAPTPENARNLLKEGVCKSAVYVTGNTVVDALLSERLEESNGEGTALITLHRRESFPLLDEMLSELADFFSEVRYLKPLFVVHPNPAVRGAVKRAERKLKEWKLIEPMEHGEFLRLLSRVSAVFTDSGGVMEEAVVLGKPVFVLRNKTERVEAVRAGAAVLLGRGRGIRDRLSRFFRDIRSPEELKAKFVESRWVFGDGKASGRIAKIIKEWLEK